MRILRVANSTCRLQGGRLSWRALRIRIYRIPPILLIRKKNRLENIRQLELVFVTQR